MECGRKLNAFTVLLQAGEIAADGVLNVGQRLLPRRALRNATWQRGALATKVPSS